MFVYVSFHTTFMHFFDMGGSFGEKKENKSKSSFLSKNQRGGHHLTKKMSLGNEHSTKTVCSLLLAGVKRFNIVILFQIVVSMYFVLFEQSFLNKNKSALKHYVLERTIEEVQSFEATLSLFIVIKHRKFTSKSILPKYFCLLIS